MTYSVPIHSFHMPLRNAVECQVTLRIIQTSKALPIIENAHKASDKRFQKKCETHLYCDCHNGNIAAGTVCLTQNGISQQSRPTAIGRKARKSQQNKRCVYSAISQSVLNIHGTKLNHFNKFVSHKISAGKSDDLLKLTKTGKLVGRTIKGILRSVDDAFLNIYPSFVEDANTPFVPDKQLILREGEKLNTDLRILALMRLGIDDTLAYRTNAQLFCSTQEILIVIKFKSRAIDRDPFQSGCNENKIHS